MSAVATISDIALLRRYTDDRDESAFAEIVRRYAGMVYAACYRVLHDKQLAEDVTQETFLKLMRRPGHVSLSLGGWLHKAATQLAIDVSRSESARRRRERVHSQDHVEFLEDQKSWKEISETIDRAMLELPEEARDLLVQHFILGRCQKEIAEEHSVSVATICRRVNDAMEQLRGVLRRRGMSMGAAMIVFDFLALRGCRGGAAGGAAGPGEDDDAGRSAQGMDDDQAHPSRGVESVAGERAGAGGGRADRRDAAGAGADPALGQAAAREHGAADGYAGHGSCTSYRASDRRLICVTGLIGICLS